MKMHERNARLAGLDDAEIAKYRDQIFEARRAQGATDDQIEAELEEYASKVHLWEHALIAQIP